MTVPLRGNTASPGETPDPDGPNPPAPPAGGQADADDSVYNQGISMRRQVLGDAHVERSMANVSDFARPVQDLVTEYVWGTVWNREGLDLRTRSLLNLVMLTALNRMHELGVHVRGAVNNGCSRDQIREALLQTAVYCGAPAALESFRVAERVLTELDAHE
ncbi:MAG: carboxymuconolactone decarboxylase family protein [Streptosporangiaceae bacterium]